MRTRAAVASFIVLGASAGLTACSSVPRPSVDRCVGIAAVYDPAARLTVLYRGFEDGHIEQAMLFSGQRPRWSVLRDEDDHTR